MGSCNDDIGQTLPQRLLAHAALHESLVEFDHHEQRQWADDLREAAAEIERLQRKADAAVAAELLAAAAAVQARVEWVPCDCGCPGAAAPKDMRASAFLLAAGMLRRRVQRP